MYELICKIGQGGMAEVYLAKRWNDGGTSSFVALKRLHPFLSARRRFVDMFHDEARLLFQLKHQNIVQLLDVASLEGQRFLVMEYVRGIDVKQLLAHRGEMLSLRLALFLIQQLLHGLHYAHTAVDAQGKPLGIIHRDISPANILISWHGEVKLADFGIAKGAHRLRETTAFGMKGKYAYMSPEQVEGKKLAQQSDLFSVGTLMYELLTGKPPFDGESDFEVIEHVRGTAFDRERLGALPAALQQMIVRALQRLPAERFASAAEMLEVLEANIRELAQSSSAHELSLFLHRRFPEESTATYQLKEPLPGKQLTQVWQTNINARSCRRRGGLCAAVLLGMSVFIPFHHQQVADDAGLNRLPLASSALEQAAAPAFLSVQATPWAHVSLPGFLTKQETPVTQFPLPPGDHLLTVRHPPTGRKLSKQLHVVAGTKLLCMAYFGDMPSLQCRPN